MFQLISLAIIGSTLAILGSGSIHSLPDDNEYQIYSNDRTHNLITDDVNMETDEHRPLRYEKEYGGWHRGYGGWHRGYGGY